MYAALKALLQQLAGGAPLASILESLVEEIEKRARGLRASILLLQDGRLRSGAAPSLPEGFNRAADGLPIGEGMGSCGTAAFRRELVVAADLQTDPLWKHNREIARRYDLGACWSIPIFDGARQNVLGTFALYHREPRQPEPEELWLVGEFAELARVAIETRRTAEALGESERRFHALIDDLEAIVWEGDADTRRFTFVDGHAGEPLGHPRQRWLDDPELWKAILHHEDREATLRHLGNELRERRDHQSEYRIVAADGRTVFIRDLIYVLPSAPGQPTRARGVMVNISRQREAEQAREEWLQQSLREQDLTRAVLQQLPEGVIVVDAPSRRVLMVNERAARITGRTIAIADSVEQHAPWFRHADGRAYTPDELPLLRALATGAPVDAEVGFVRGDGSRCTLSVAATPVLDRSQRIVAALVAFSNISERKQAEHAQCFLADAGAALVRSLDWDATLRRFAELAVQQLADCCLVFTQAEDGALCCLAAAHGEPDGAALAARFARLAQQPGGAPCGLSSVLAHGKPRLFGELGPDAFEAGAVRTELMHLMRELGVQSAMTVPWMARDRVFGAIVYCSRQPRRYDSGDVEVAEEVARRLALAWENARLYVEAQQAIAQREEFLSVAAHELNTPLAGLQLAIQTIGLQLEKPQIDRDILRQRVSSGERQSKRLGRLIEQLLDVSRLNAGRMRLDRAEMDLVEAVQGVVGRFGEELAARHIDLAVHTPEPVVGAWDRLRVEQVLTNLMSNAIKYGRGRPIRVMVTASPEVAICSVEDQGLGMAPELMQRLFRPFERGVAAGEYGGLGLGLYITDQIVRAHGGAIRVQSSPGSGSAFTVELPRMLASPPSQR
jgi:PAS domain S-box-containing protein